MAAKDRAVKRRAAAIEAAAVAQKDLDEADAAIAAAESEIHRIQSLIPSKAEMHPKSCIQSLETSCTSVLSDIAQSRHVSVDMVTEVEQYMKQLLTGLKSLSASIQSAEAAAAPK